jgi:hypothetical protein
MNDEQLAQIIKTEKPHLKPITVKGYIKSLTYIKNDANGDDNFDFLDDANKVLKAIEHRPQYWKATNLVSVLTLLKARGKETGEAYKKYYDVSRSGQIDYHEKNESGEKNQKEQKNMISVQEYNDLIDKTATKTEPNGLNEYYNAMFHFLLVLYKYDPSRNDYADMVVVKTKKEAEESDMNVLLLNKKPTLIFKKYKTDKTYGIIENPINDKTVLAKIRWWLKINKNNTYLISSFDGSKLTRLSLSKLLTRHFVKHLDKNISSSMIRKIFGSELHEQNKALKDAQKKFKHGAGAQQLYIKNNV